MKKLLIVFLAVGSIVGGAWWLISDTTTSTASPTMIHSPEFCYPCDLTGPQGVPDGAITLQDTGLHLSHVGTRAPTPVPTVVPFVGSCYFVDHSGFWELKSTNIWPQSFHGQEVMWWWEVNDVVQDWSYDNTLSVSGGNASGAIIDGHIPGSGDIYAGIPQLDGSINPYAAECEFTVP